MVGAYVATEGSRLEFIRYYQTELHIAPYVGLTDYLNTRAKREENTVDTLCVLPSILFVVREQLSKLIKTHGNLC